MQILINHLGYDSRSSKRFVVKTAAKTGAFSLINARGEQAFAGTLTQVGAVDRWQDWRFSTGDFSEFTQPGQYRLVVRLDGETGESAAFEIRRHLLTEQCTSDMLCYFKSQRCSGKYDQTDRAIPFVGTRTDRVDVHGGWYDASGDVSKYLSHLSYANFMNPQQIPMVVWNLLQSGDFAAQSDSLRLRSLVERMREEALFGADFLVRMLDPAGYFYMTVFDKWTKDLAQREICAYATQKGVKSDEYQAAYRQGGGVAIAALARSSALGAAGDYAPETYLNAAETGFRHLEAHNRDYLNDGKENIIDDYCALLAAVELFSATGNQVYLARARQRKDALLARLAEDQTYSGWWRADDGARPYFHAAEAGLPVVALLRYREVEPDAQAQAAVLAAARRSLNFELAMTNEVANPFGYARQYVQDLSGGKRGAFFFPHHNESGYWWQGENARLGSLAAATFMAAPLFDAEFGARLNRYAMDQVNWILGLNPLDMCMLQGRGRNNPADYLDAFPNAPGGVCNGITAGCDDEHDLAFLPAQYANDMAQNWRWSEQWIPHAAWLLLALAAS